MRFITSGALLTIILCGCGSQTQPETDTAAVQAEARKPAAEGAMCGGYPGVQCTAGNYCAIEKGRCAIIADVSGTCRKKPEVCTMQMQPVCGCDRKTYSNSCAAAAAGVSVASDGECK
jgi:hypothetical protein